MSDESEWEAENAERSDGSEDDKPKEDVKPSRSRSRPSAKTGDETDADATESKRGANDTGENEDEGNSDQQDESNTGRRRKKLRRVDFDAETDEINYLPSYQRATEAGGYMHTKNSRLKISQANKGKMPWNKGKNRSESAKAKISAGVRARNHAILLAKLAKLNLTEDEWNAKRKQIKLLRERVRKAKVAAAKHLASKSEKQTSLEDQLSKLEKEMKVGNDETENQNLPSTDTLPNGSFEARLESIVQETVAAVEASTLSAASESEQTATLNAAPVTEALQASTLHVACEPVQTTMLDAASGPTTRGETNLTDTGTNTANDPLPILPDPQPRALSIFARDIEWTPHAFDVRNEHNEAVVPYSALCPVGGPGGLICCDACTSLYAQYMTKTVTNLEAQKLQHMGKDVQELLEMTRAAKETLASTIKVARRKPMPMRSAATKAAPKQPPVPRQTPAARQRKSNDTAIKAKATVNDALLEVPLVRHEPVVAVPEPLDAETDDESTHNELTTWSV